MTPSRFLIACALSVVTTLTAVAAVNFTVDVSRIYHADDSNEHARIIDFAQRLQKSKDGMVAVPWDRALKWELARQSDAECFVTGSSRAMVFGIEQLRMFESGCRSVANLGVNGAGFEDFVTAAGLIAEKPLPKAVYVGVDPWALRFNADARWTGFERVYHSSRRRLGLSDKEQQHGWDAFANLLNGQYLLANINSVTSGHTEIPIKAVEPDGANVLADENVLLPDGSLVYSQKYKSPRPVPDDRIGNGATKIQPPYLDPRVTAEFEYVLNGLSARGIRIVLLLAPYHPKVMRCQSPKACAALTAVEEWARDLAQRHGYQIIGSFDPRRFGIGPELFHDELHMDAAAIKYLVPGQVSFE